MSDKEIGLFKLVSTEELVSEYKTDGEFYLLRAPRRIVLTQASQTEVKPSLIPWFIGGNPDGIYPVHMTHIISPTHDIPEGLKKAYLAQTSPLDLSAVNSTKLVV